MFANGRIYKLNYDLQRASKYVEGITFAKDVINDIHKLMATIAEPVTWYGKKYERSHEQIAEDMEHANFEAAYNAAVFFYLLSNPIPRALSFCTVSIFALPLSMYFFMLCLPSRLIP